ncbi:DUF3908 family protein [Bacillus horti]|uniref:DUF3908 domain-containing protein n=1 Tax=Caldalkalibacillus horti TaxID=77523 RepID=A0ABT9W3D1_9BACI|nr:DUF3908 family protein [Bacillus horti]MDQ0167744.1 hypothetical protein [Bacillus horti]
MNKITYQGLLNEIDDRAKSQFGLGLLIDHLKRNYPVEKVKFFYAKDIFEKSKPTIFYLITTNGKFIEITEDDEYIQAEIRNERDIKKAFYKEVAYDNEASLVLHFEDKTITLSSLEDTKSGPWVSKHDKTIKDIYAYLTRGAELQESTL